VFPLNLDLLLFVFELEAISIVRAKNLYIFLYVFLALNLRLLLFKSCFFIEPEIIRFEAKRLYLIKTEYKFLYN
jgi:hypothetical protein